MAVRFLIGPGVMAAASLAVGLRGTLLCVAIVQVIILLLDEALVAGSGLAWSRVMFSAGTACIFSMQHCTHALLHCES
jgi:hypothetical protein